MQSHSTGMMGAGVSATGAKSARPNYREGRYIICLVALHLGYRCMWLAKPIVIEESVPPIGYAAKSAD